MGLGLVQDRGTRSLLGVREGVTPKDRTPSAVIAQRGRKGGYKTALAGTGQHAVVEVDCMAAAASSVWTARMEGTVPYVRTEVVYC